MKHYFFYSLILILSSGCAAIYFAQPMPGGGQEVSILPEKLMGYYGLEDDSTAVMKISQPEARVFMLTQGYLLGIDSLQLFLTEENAQRAELGLLPLSPKDKTKINDKYIASNDTLMILDMDSKTCTVQFMEKQTLSFVLKKYKNIYFLNLKDPEFYSLISFEQTDNGLIIQSSYLKNAEDTLAITEKYGIDFQKSVEMGEENLIREIDDAKFLEFWSDTLYFDRGEWIKIKAKTPEVAQSGFSKYGPGALILGGFALFLLYFRGKKAKQPQ